MNQKLVSVLRQHSSIAHTLHTSDQNIRHLTHSLKTQAGKDYGESIPLDPGMLADWCISRIAACGSSAGMETFRDEGKEGTVTVLLGGKVLVIDVDFAIDRSDPQKARIKSVNVKTSYAATNDSSSNTANANRSPFLDKFLSNSIQAFCNQLQDGDRDNVQAAVRVKLISEQLQYLVLLDGLASRKDSAGVKWFTDLDEQWPMLEGLTRQEGAVIASSLSGSHAPLDIFLQRAHALPLPYLNCPSLSFLVYLSPAAYLSLIRQPRVVQTEGQEMNLDISISQLREYLASRHQGVTLGTLRLIPRSGVQLYPASMSMPSLTPRPTFPLYLKGSELEHAFLEAPTTSSTLVSSSVESYGWVVDFTQGGRQAGVVLSQSRMREIETIINPLGGIDTVGILSLQPASWVNLLLSPDSHLPSERYVATYRSPSGAHPPLSLRLICPNEPGFILQKVPVHNLREVWGILEVVRDQCWLNALLLGCQWDTESLDDADDMESEATEQELMAILSGVTTPRKIPVNVYLPSNDTTAESLFGTSLDSMAMGQIPRRPKIVMTSPERPPMSGLVEITIVCDETKPRGVSVEVNGAMGAEIRTQELEEMCRRGGVLGLSGKVWMHS